METKAAKNNRKRGKSPASNPTKNRKKRQTVNKEEIEIDVEEIKPNINKQTKIPKQNLFKNPKYRETGFTAKTKTWKNLKQILVSEKSQKSQNQITYASLTAGPSKKPIKKYSDISGLPALYTDPHTKLRYSNSDEYREIQHLSTDRVIGFLMLRQTDN